jgi:predicted O-methyltransferase YrrM
MPSTLKSIARKVLGQKLLGAIDYYRYPDRRQSFRGPFNGQPFRQALFRSLIEQLKPVAIVETGTFLGTTTAFMAETGLPVFTVEAHPRRYGFARARLWRFRRVTLRNADSRTMLTTLFKGPLRRFSGRTLFVYLDAHSNDNLPLAEELETVFHHCPAAVVMIDDFCVPSDAGYRYDDYGPDKALTASYVAPVVAAHGLCAYYPSTPSVCEGGARRGCIVLAKDAIHRPILASLCLLDAASPIEVASSKDSMP